MKPIKDYIYEWSYEPPKRHVYSSKVACDMNGNDLEEGDFVVYSPKGMYVSPNFAKIERFETAKKSGNIYAIIDFGIIEFKKNEKGNFIPRGGSKKAQVTSLIKIGNPDYYN